MEMALSARTSRIFHEIFSCPLVFLVVKKLSPSFTAALQIPVTLEKNIFNILFDSHQGHVIFKYVQHFQLDIKAQH